MFNIQHFGVEPVIIDELYTINCNCNASNNTLPKFTLCSKNKRLRGGIIN